MRQDTSWSGKSLFLSRLMISGYDWTSAFKADTHVCLCRLLLDHGAGTCVAFRYWTMMWAPA